MSTHKKTKLALKWDDEFWPHEVERALEAEGLGEHLPKVGGTYWSSRNIPRHHQRLIELLEQHEQKYPMDDKYVHEVDLPSGRYLIISKYKSLDLVIVPEHAKWVTIPEAD